MFPIAHAWLLEQLVATPTAAHYLGCVWPDMLFESPLTHPQSHRQGRELIAFAATLPTGRERDLFRAFVAGALTHGSEPHGFDWYSDEQFGAQPIAARGYAFQHGRTIARDAARACGVAEEQGWWKAHNFVEMAFERELCTEHPQLSARLLAAIADDALVDAIAGLLARHFDLPASQLGAPIRRFPAVAPLRPTSLEHLAEKYAMQVRLKHPGAQPDVAAIAQLLARSEELIAADRDAYLTVCVREVGGMLGETAITPR